MKIKATGRGTQQMARSFNEEEGEMSIKQTDRRATPTGAVILASGSMNKL